MVETAEGVQGAAGTAPAVTEAAATMEVEWVVEARVAEARVVAAEAATVAATAVASAAETAAGMEAATVVAEKAAPTAENEVY